MPPDQFERLYAAPKIFGRTIPEHFGALRLATKQAEDAAKYAGEPSIEHPLHAALLSSDYPDLLVKGIMAWNLAQPSDTAKGIEVGSGKPRSLEQFYQDVGGKAEGGPIIKEPAPSTDIQAIIAALKEHHAHA